MAIMAAAAITSAAIGAGQLVAGGIQSRKAKAMRPPLEDAEQRLELARLKRQASAFETGAAFNKERATLSNAIKQQVAGAGRISGGAGGAAIAAGARGAMNIGQIVSKLGVQGQQLGMQQRQAASAVQAGISQRKLELQLYSMAQKKAQAEQNKKAGAQNLMAGASTFLGGLSSAGKTGGGVTGQISDVAAGDVAGSVADVAAGGAGDVAAGGMSNKSSTSPMGNPDDLIFGSDPKNFPFSGFDFSSNPDTKSSNGKSFNEYNLLSKSLPLINQLIQIGNGDPNQGSENFDMGF